MLPLIIFIDTNVLYHASDYGIHIEKSLDDILYKKYKIVVHTRVEEEIIEDLTLPGKRGRKAKLAMQLLNNYEVFEDDREYEGTDIALLKSAKRVRGAVFTFDKKLRDRCKEASVPVITNYLKGKLQIIGFIE